MTKYGATISDPVVIEVPSGTQWEMGLRESNGDIWLAKGWREFAQHHSLENGQALFFKYKGRSHFDVVIVGVSGLEIDYPILNSNQFNESDIDDGDDDDDDVSPWMKTEEKSAPPCSHARNRVQGNFGDNHTQCGSDELKYDDPISKTDNLHRSKSKEMEGMPIFLFFGLFLIAC